MLIIWMRPAQDVLRFIRGMVNLEHFIMILRNLSPREFRRKTVFGAVLGFAWVGVRHTLGFLVPGGSRKSLEAKNGNASNDRMGSDGG